MFICIKQQLSNIWGSVHEKLSNTEAELKKALLIKKTCIMTTQKPSKLQHSTSTW